MRYVTALFCALIFQAAPAAALDGTAQPTSVQTGNATWESGYARLPDGTVVKVGNDFITRNLNSRTVTINGKTYFWDNGMFELPEIFD